jgi:hypothetical protein
VSLLDEAVHDVLQVLKGRDINHIQPFLLHFEGRSGGEHAALDLHAVGLLQCAGGDGGLAQAGTGSHFDDGGFPAGKGWDEMALPSVDDEHSFALEISGDQMRPAYRDGDVIVVSPATPIRRGDRVVVKTTGGEVMVKELKRRTAKALELQSLNPSQADRTLAAADIAWIARIVWSSQ